MLYRKGEDTNCKQKKKKIKNNKNKHGTQNVLKRDLGWWSFK